MERSHHSISGLLSTLDDDAVAFDLDDGDRGRFLNEISDGNHIDDKRRQVGLAGLSTSSVCPDWLTCKCAPGSGADSKGS